MKKYILPLSLALGATLTMSAGSKLSGNAQVYINYYKNLMENPTANLAVPYRMPFEINTKSRGATTATVYITMAEGVSADDIQARGFEVKSQAGNMLIASGSIESIESLGESDLVTNIEFGGKADPTLMRARAFIGADDIHNGSNGLSRPYTGAGVICGIYDIGIDPNHPNFKKRGDLKTNRVKHLWYFNGSDGSYIEKTTDSEIESFGTDTNNESHGTHTLGCMAGAHNENSSGTSAYTYLDANGAVKYYGKTPNKGKNPYYGIAYDADLAVSCGGLYDNNTTVAVSKMIDYANEQNKPIVVSLSIGTTIGSHDEYGAFTRYIDELGKKAIICIAAGNDGQRNISIRKTLTSSDNEVKTFLGSTGSGSLSIYSNDATPFTITPVIYDIIEGESIWTTNTVTISEAGTKLITAGYSNGDSYGAFTNAFSNSYLRIVTDKNESTSNRYSATISFTLTNNQTSNNRGTKVLGFIIKGATGQTIEVGSGVALSSYGMDGWDKGSPDFSISSMACGKNVIVVGAYNANSTLIPAIKEILSQAINTAALTDSSSPNYIADFTSYGELSDGRKLPHVCAPGNMVISSVNSYQTEYETLGASDANYCVSAYTTVDGKKYYWAPMSGTSMSTPIVAGSIATWLEAYPQLTFEEALQAIQETAIQDEYTAVGNQIQWGAGKFNAIGGLKKLLGIAGVSNIKVDKDNIIVTNTGNNVYEVFVSGADQVNAQIYNISGQLVSNQSGDGEQINVDASNLTHGIYILKVNGTYSQRILVK